MTLSGMTSFQEERPQSLCEFTPGGLLCPYLFQWTTALAAMK